VPRALVLGRGTHQQLVFAAVLAYEAQGIPVRFSIQSCEGIYGVFEYIESTWRHRTPPSPESQGHRATDINPKIVEIGLSHPNTNRESRNRPNHLTRTVSKAFSRVPTAHLVRISHSLERRNQIAGEQRARQGSARYRTSESAPR
jgi:hypothetical protein